MTRERDGGVRKGRGLGILEKIRYRHKAMLGRQVDDVGTQQARPADMFM
jgi:hypothetical protein